MNRRLVLATLSLAVALAGCTAGKKRVGSPGATATAAPQWSSRERVGKAIELLNQGKREPARRELREVLERFPSDPVARNLYGQLDIDPKAKLGTQNFPYKVKPGERMSEIAQRFLGDPVQFYILARYNGIEAPGAIEGGQTILIPGRPRPPSPPREEVKRPTAPGAKPPPATPAAPAVVRDTAGANRLRGAALEQMNRGQIDRAVGLLRQAQARDPDNALIRRDLDRATRIRSTVQSRR